MIEKLDLKDYIVSVIDQIARLEEIRLDNFPEPLIGKNVVLDILKTEKFIFDKHNSLLPKIYSKIMYVEDGTVDIDELKESMPDTKIIVYRAGGRPPELKDISVTPLKGY